MEKGDLLSDLPSVLVGIALNLAGVAGTKGADSLMVAVRLRYRTASVSEAWFSLESYDLRLLAATSCQRQTGQNATEQRQHRRFWNRGIGSVGVGVRYRELIRSARLQATGDPFRRASHREGARRGKVSGRLLAIECVLGIHGASRGARLSNNVARGGTDTEGGRAAETFDRGGQRGGAGEVGGGIAEFYFIVRAAGAQRIIVVDDQVERAQRVTRRKCRYGASIRTGGFRRSAIRDGSYCIAAAGERAVNNGRIGIHRPRARKGQHRQDC